MLILLLRLSFSIFSFSILTLIWAGCSSTSPKANWCFIYKGPCLHIKGFLNLLRLEVLLGSSTAPSYEPQCSPRLVLWSSRAQHRP